MAVSGSLAGTQLVVAHAIQGKVSVCEQGKQARQLMDLTLACAVLKVHHSRA